MSNMLNNICVQCGKSRQQIKERGYICGEVDYFGELQYEFPRHRFKPYSEKELKAQARDEMEYVKQMGEMADFINKEMDLSEHLNK